MRKFSPRELNKLYIPPPNSHKGQNGKLLIVAGSQLFHAPAIWPAQIASRIVDMVYVASTPENNQILKKLKGKFWDGIVIRREDIDDYAKEADCILIGPGLPRKEGLQKGDDDSKELVKYVLCDLLPQSKFSHSDNHVIAKVRKNGGLKSKKVVIDGGALQTMEVSWIPRNSILTPHQGEFERLVLGSRFEVQGKTREEQVKEFSREYECVVLLKGREDIVCSPEECRVVRGGNAGMTKGGSGDVLAGLVAALACKNDLFLAACAGAYINKQTGKKLFKRVGYYYNASDLLNEIPGVMKELISDFRGQ